MCGDALLALEGREFACIGQHVDYTSSANIMCKPSNCTCYTQGEVMLCSVAEKVYVVAPEVHKIIIQLDCCAS